jgi:hypothetical protein
MSFRLHQRLATDAAPGAGASCWARPAANTPSDRRVVI